MKMWKNIDKGYYITLESCAQRECNGQKVINDIIKHYIEGEDEVKNNWIIIDTHFLSMNWDEYIRFRKGVELYRSQGFDTDETF
ncbi:hypothetical protein H8Z60_07000 [Mycolicibacterium fortuitum]|nr:hypothetical protein [Mycolicibacterium fortuitum]